MAENVFRMGGTWGDSISWFDVARLEVVGWKTPKPKVGDVILSQMQSGRTGRFVVNRHQPAWRPAGHVLRQRAPRRVPGCQRNGGGARWQVTLIASAERIDDVWHGVLTLLGDEPRQVECFRSPSCEDRQHALAVATVTGEKFIADMPHVALGIHSPRCAREAARELLQFRPA